MNGRQTIRNTVRLVAFIAPGALLIGAPTFLELSRGMTPTCGKLQWCAALLGVAAVLAGVWLATSQLRWRQLIPRLLLAGGSGFLTLLAVEAAYRVVLQRRHAAEQPRFLVQSRNIHTFDRELGYTYLPDTTGTVARIANRRVDAVWTCAVNAEGNVGDPAIAANWRVAGTKILVAGDSFTANPHYGGIAWPDSMAAALLRRFAADVSVRNFGRDGYGVLQMVRMAAVQARIHEPTMILIAFITDDLTRARIWMSAHEDDQCLRVFSTSIPTDRPDAADRVDAVLVNPRIANRALGADATDMVDQFERLTAPTRNRQRRLFRSLKHSFLWNRLMRGDPLAGLFSPLEGDRHRLRDFRADAGFAQDAAALNRLGIPIVLVHLPVYQEIAAQRYLPDARAVSLTASLRNAFTRAPFVELLPELRSPTGRLEDAYQLPHDLHPSRIGAAMYGEAIARAVERIETSRRNGRVERPARGSRRPRGDARRRE